MVAADDMIRVAIVDDERIFAESLARLLSDSDDIEVLGIAHNGADAVAMAVRKTPDVMLIDYRMPGQDGIEITLEIRRQSPSVNVVMLTGSQDNRTLLAAIEAGCSGFLTKDQRGSEVVDAVRSAAAGESVIAPTTLARLLPTISRSATRSGGDLTSRELQVLSHLVRGEANKAIADDLFLSVNTVRNYVQSILMKLGAHSKLEAVATAIREGVIDYPDAR